MIAVIIDISQKLEDFLGHDLTYMQILKEYYLNYIPYINGLIWPLYALIAVIFFTSRLAYNSEVISILNAGVSFNRFLRPYLIAAFIFAGIHFIGNHFIIPLGNQGRVDFEMKYMGKHRDDSKMYNIHFYINPNEKVFIQNWIKKDTLARKFRMETFDGNKLVKLVSAKEARWKGPPSMWTLVDYEIRTFNGQEEEIVNGFKEKMDIDIKMLPSDIAQRTIDKDRMISTDLLNRIKIERIRGAGHTKLYEIEVHRRTADTFTVIILTIIGMTLAARKVRGGMGLHLALGAGLGAIYIFLSKFAITFATNNTLHPLIGVWIPNFVFLIISCFLVLRAQK